MNGAARCQCSQILLILGSPDTLCLCWQGADHDRMRPIYVDNHERKNACFAVVEMLLHAVQIQCILHVIAEVGDVLGPCLQAFDGFEVEDDLVGLDADFIP